MTKEWLILLEVRMPEQSSEMPRPDACWDLLVADAVEVLGSRHGVRVVSAAGDGSPCVRLQFEIAPLTL